MQADPGQTCTTILHHLDRDQPARPSPALRTPHAPLDLRDQHVPIPTLRRGSVVVEQDDFSGLRVHSRDPVEAYPPRQGDDLEAAGILWFGLDGALYESFLFMRPSLLDVQPEDPLDVIRVLPAHPARPPFGPARDDRSQTVDHRARAAGERAELGVFGGAAGAMTERVHSCRNVTKTNLNRHFHESRSMLTLDNTNQLNDT